MLTKKRWWVPWAFLALPLIMYIIWVLVPIGRTFIYSFSSWDGLSKNIDFIGLDNFRMLFGDRIFITALMNNIKWFILFIIIPVPVGLGFAMLLDMKLPGSKLFKTLVYLPMTLSFVVIGTMWSWIYEPQYGALNSFLDAIGLDFLITPWLSDPQVVTFSLIFAAIWRQIPYVMVLFLAGLKNVSKDQVEAAYVDGANAWQRFWNIILPALRPSMIVAVTVSIIDSLRAFDIVFVMTKGGPFHSSTVLANFMYIEAFNNYRMGYGSAIAVIQFAITFGFIILYLLNVMKNEE
ncbi:MULTISPECIES: carbohydrate ABC transporter permease [Bacteria]|jgi:multiple sugar transport system permease protein/raffinose/stachyose/melibiose transport system permease protein|uniref:Carbohydrate ABC transporter membrane protein 1, CUT1 family n=1 Tax=Geotoga petraea TaxID=28234 RepID=A0A1G6M1Q2_9BACT|nr:MULTISPECIES: sugar ABC transporter permease [Bacteria]MDK2946624.1 multiple sugar transport system permease protein [Geotoga sp.]PUU87954.1 MAG: multiple sugar transport system permease protein [Halanaerobium sp.]SDC48915.1 carbohydrate ABC transporter membrane protein 1, CUT1 family [Geotoga petraea]